MYRDLNVYIDLDWEELIEKGYSYINQMSSLIDFAYQHRVTVYYQKHHIENICNLDENFIESIPNLLDVILKDAKMIEKSNRFLFDIEFAQQNSIIKSKNFHLNSESKNCIIGLNKASENKTFLSIVSSSQFERIEVYHCSSLHDFADWVFKTIPKRNFNHNPKHGDDFKKAFKDNKGLKVSNQGFSDNDAQELLRTAIPHFNKQFVQAKICLYNYDSVIKSYVKFYYEGETPQNFWHGHAIEEKDVPSEIIKILNNLVSK